MSQINSTSGTLTIIDPQSDSVKVYWNGIAIPVLDVIVGKKEVLLRVLEAQVVPADLLAQENITVRRRSQ